MKALRLKLYQQTACYKKPFAFKVSETYPLPSYSTVKGMLHAVMEAKELIPMKISIQGNYDTLVTDYQTHYFFKNANTNEFALTVDGLGIEREMSDITTMPIYMHMLYHVELLIHVTADENILHILAEKLLSNCTHLSLGRWEDIVRIDECEMVELIECEEEMPLRYNAYVPKRILTEEPHFPYNLNWIYTVVNGVRVWEKIPVGFMHKGEEIIELEELQVDSYGDLVFFP